MLSVKKSLFVCIFLIVSVAPQAASATVWSVDPNGGDFTSISAAISDTGVINGDTITVAAGTYYEVIDYQGKNITIRSLSGATNTTIDGYMLGDSVVTFQTGETSSAVLDGFTLIRGDGKLFGNTRSGGGVYISGASPTIQNCVILNNTINPGDGGGMIIYGGGSPVIKNCLISNNSVNQDGAGIYISGTGTNVTISSSEIRFNTITGGAYGYGSGVYIDASANVTFTNSLMISNDNGNPYAYGGGIYSQNSDLVLMNCTLAGNTVSGTGVGVGGAVYYTSTASYTTTIQNTIFWGNTATTSGDDVSMYGSGRNYLYSNDIDVTNNVSGTGSWTASSGNINANPQFIIPGEDFHILRTSPCFDTGTQPVLTTSETYVDRDNNTRPQALAFDIGAYEVVYDDYDGDGYTIANGDCDDTNAAVNPAGTEICGNAIDEDCSGSDLACVATDDHGDSSGTATGVAIDATTNGSIGVTTDIDYFSFSALADTIYLIEVTLGTLPDSYVKLIDTDGRTVLGSASGSGSGATVTIAWSSTAAGTYYSSVSPLTQVSGDYTISIKTFTPTFTATASDGTMTLNWQANAIAALLGYKVYIGTASGVYGTPVDVGDVLTYTATGLTNNTTYYAKVTYYDDQSAEHAYASEVHCTPYPGSTSSTYNYTGGPASYSMISFPSTLADPDPVNNLSPILNPNPDGTTNPYDPAIWRLYAYDNAYHQPSDGYTCTSLYPGRGFWVVSLNDAAINLTGASVDTNTDFTITIPNGWFMIGNPFGFNVNVSDLAVNDGTTTALVTAGSLTLPDIYYYQNGAYVSVTQILPNRGYWIKNTSGASLTLTIPPSAAATLPAPQMTKTTSSDETPPPPPKAQEASPESRAGCFIAEASYENAKDKNIMEILVDYSIRLLKKGN